MPMYRWNMGFMREFFGAESTTARSKGVYIGALALGRQAQIPR